MKKSLSLLLAIVLIISTLFSFAYNASAANVKINKTKATMAISTTVKLTLKEKGKNVSTKAKWSSSDSKIATVKKGKVTSKKAGKAVITAKYKGKKYKCKITVKSSVSVNNSNVTISENADSESVTVTFTEKESTIYFDVIQGEDVIYCSWAKDWEGKKTKLYIKRKNNSSNGVAKVKIYSKHKKNYKIINVTVYSKRSPTTTKTTTAPKYYNLIVKNELPAVLNNRERATTLNPSGIRNTLTVNSLNYSMNGSTMYIDVDITASSSAYSGSDYYYIFYKITDENGYVVQSDYTISERLSVGDRSIKRIYVYSLNEGTYYIELLDHNAA